MTITPEQKQILLKQQHEYYHFLPALFEIVKEAKGHTIDMLNAKDEDTKFGIRYFNPKTIDYLQSHLKAMGISEGKRLGNVYRSNALLKQGCIPVFSYDLKMRKTTAEYQEFNKNYLALAEGFDLIFDIDSPKKDVMDSYEKAKEIKIILDNFKVPYYCKNSGRRGFHFIIPAQFMPKMEISKLILTINRILTHFRAIHDMIEYLDTTVTNPKGLIKCSYSFDSGNISLPLNDFDFLHFSPEKVKCEYVMKNVIIKNRGLFLRTHNLTTSELEQNTIKFIEEYK